jgi:hypothetical protein
MSLVLDADVFTRRTATVHEDFDTQVDRFTPDLWREYAEKLPVSPGFHLDHIAVSDPNDAHQLAIFPDRTHRAKTITVDKELAAFAREFRQFRDCLYHVEKNVILAILTRATNETSTPISFIRVTQQQRLRQERVTDATIWTDEKNRRRCDLVDKEITGNISLAEKAELKRLQAEMLAYRRRVAPLPLEDLRALHQELLRKGGDNSE